MRHLRRQIAWKKSREQCFGGFFRFSCATITQFDYNLFLKEFLGCSCCFGLFNKIKKGSGASFCCIFSAWFFCKNIPYLILYQWTKFQSHTFFLSQDIKQNVLLISYLVSWWCHDVKTFLGSTSKAMADKGKKEGKMEIQKFEYLKNEKSFSDEIKKYFL